MTQPRVCFVIPTYDEASNIVSLLERLTGLYPEADVLVVDDDSPDGTGALVAGFAGADGADARGRRVHLLTGSKRGLGVAYIRGMQHAMDVLGADVVVQMDADFSHAPEDAGRLLERLAAGFDVAIGSRYVPGGSVDAGWGVKRRMLSRWGNRFARYVAGIWGVRDCTSGFKAIRADVLRETRLDALTVKGYAFQVALLYRLVRAGAKIVEVPIHFRDRSRGETKLGLRDVVEFFVRVWWLRILSTRTFIKFSITGTTGILVNLGTFAALVAGGVDKLLASPVAIEVSVVWNFFLNNYWTFRHRTLSGRKRVRGVKFNLVSLVTVGVSYTTFVLLTLAFPDGEPLVHQGLGIVPSVVLNYFLNSYWTFRDARE